MPRAKRGYPICADYEDKEGARGIAWLRKSFLKAGFLYNYSPYDLRPGGAPPTIVADFEALKIIKRS